MVTHLAAAGLVVREEVGLEAATTVEDSEAAIEVKEVGLEDWGNPLSSSNNVWDSRRLDVVSFSLRYMLLSVYLARYIV